MASATYLSTPSSSASASSAAVTSSLSPDDFDSPPGTPVRTLRRKRSSANAALTTRPSILSLRNRSASTSSSNNGPHGSGNVGDSMASIDVALGGLTLAPSPTSKASTATASRPADCLAARTSHSHETAMAELIVSPSTLVLLHAVEKREGGNRGGNRALAHALFAPNLLVDAHGRVSSLTRTQWERARATVEEARIVRLGGVVGDNRSPRHPVSSLSAENNKSGGGDSLGVKLETVLFGGEGEGREQEERLSTTSCTTFYLQARAAVDQIDLVDEENLDNRKREDKKKHGNPGHYLEIVIRDLDKEQTRAHLPSQLHALLEQSDSFTSPQTQAKGAKVEDEGSQELCNEILDLVKTKAL